LCQRPDIAGKAARRLSDDVVMIRFGRFSWSAARGQRPGRPSASRFGLYDEAVAKTCGQRRDRPSSSLRFETYVEGGSLQPLHVGSDDEEGLVLKRLREEMPGLGVSFNGAHHGSIRAIREGKRPESSGRC
jgi:hypothetical protein